MKKNSDKIQVARIVSVHGIKGCVNLMSYTEDPKNIEKYQQLFDFDQKVFFKIKLLSDAGGKNRDIFIAKIEGVESRDQAISLVGTELYTERDQLPDLPDDEFYYADLIGMEVVNIYGDRIGKVIAVSNFGAGGMLEIEFYQTDKDSDKSQILPFRDCIFPEVNLKKKYIRIIMPEFVE